MLTEILLLILAIPTGFLIAWLARDELIAGRRWFLVLIVLGLILGVLFFILGSLIIVWTYGFILIVSFIAYVKSFDKKWTKRRI